MIKAIVIFLIVCLTIYSPLELSRMIFAYSLDLEFMLEFGLIWASYIAAIAILIKVVKV